MLRFFKYEWSCYNSLHSLKRPFFRSKRAILSITTTKIEILAAFVSTFLCKGYGFHCFAIYYDETYIQYISIFIFLRQTVSVINDRSWCIIIVFRFSFAQWHINNCLDQTINNTLFFDIYNQSTKHEIGFWICIVSQQNLDKNNHAIFISME